MWNTDCHNQFANWSRNDIVGADALGGPRGASEKCEQIPGENVLYYEFAEGLSHVFEVFLPGCRGRQPLQKEVTFPVGMSLQHVL